MVETSQTIRILLADDHTLVRAGLRVLLEKLPAVEVVGEASDGREVLALVRTVAPDIVLMDIAMPGLNGLEATERIARDWPAVRVIMLSMHRNEAYVWRALKAGASGYLLKKAATDELDAALRRMVRGEIYLSPQVSGRLFRTPAAPALSERRNPLERLTSRQREILQLIAEGESTKAIALILRVSPKTVEYHRARLMAQLNIHDIAGLVRFALREGLVTQES